MATVTNFQFWVGDGVTTAFTIMDPSGVAAINPVVSALYRTDWQGKTLLLTTARTNRVLRSQELGDAAWTATRASISSNAITAPDGTVTADKITEDNTAASTHLCLSTASITVVDATVYTLSVYAKAGERNWFALQEGQGVAATAYFNLSTGAVGSVVGTGTPSATIASIGNGWYRCTLTFTTSGVAAKCRLYVANADNGAVYNGDGVSGFYAWGPQMELGSSATSYIPTLGSVVTITDYSVAASTATFAQTPLDRALLEWTGTDDNAAFIPISVGSALPFGGFSTMGAD